MSLRDTQSRILHTTLISAFSLSFPWIRSKELLGEGSESVRLSLGARSEPSVWDSRIFITTSFIFLPVHDPYTSQLAMAHSPTQLPAFAH